MLFANFNITISMHSAIFSCNKQTFADLIFTMNGKIAKSTKIAILRKDTSTVFLICIFIVPGIHVYVLPVYTCTFSPYSTSVECME